jgi:hypothetical protein
MAAKLFILNFLLLFTVPSELLPQAKSAFSGDPASFRSELTTFMGPNLNPSQIVTLNTFLTRWDSSGFSKENMLKIIDISSLLSARSMRPVPNFINYLTTLNYFIDYKRDASFFDNWLNGLSEITFSKRFTNDNIDKYFKSTGSMIKDNILYESGSAKWKVKNSQIRFMHDTIFYVTVSDATLTCYSQKDSTEIYNVTGTYYPELQQFRGSKGIVTWEKAGYPRKDVFAELNKYTINITKGNYVIDSAKLTHSTYFKKPVLGKLTDQAITFSNKEKANYPRFEAYTKKFFIKDLYKGVNYEGGLTFEGANIKGTGENFIPAIITLLRNDTLYIKINSKEYLFSKNSLTSQETVVSLYLGKDSIYHSNLGFSYFADTRQVNLFRTNNPVSKSPYFNSFHSLDMYFEYLSWNMNESKIILSRARGAALGQAQFESTSFFNSEYFLRLMGMDEYHPLNRLIKFAEYYYSETFPVAEFAKWLNKPDESVTGMCIDLANKGFIFYDRINNIVTIKKKTKDFLDSYAKRKDYDILNILSETKAPKDNATLDLKNYRLTVNGVSGVFLSDSQRVAIYPYKQQLVIGKNRRIEFDGVVQAGLFTVYGHKFSFSYDSFKIKLQKIDSIKIAVETDKKDTYGNPIIEGVDNLIQLATAELYIDDPDNKSGLKSFNQYPIIDASSYSYIFYDRIPGLEGIYKQSDFYFKIDPFTYNNIDHYTSQEMNLSGEFVGGNILKPMRQNLTIQENNSLGFNMIIPKEGIDVYGDKGKLFDEIKISNKGLIGSGTLKHLTSTTKSEEYKFFPDSMIAQATTFNIEKDEQGKFPILSGENVGIKWFTQKDEWLATNPPGKYFSMFGNGTTLDGTINLTTARLKGSGIVNMADSRITSNLFSFASSAIRADTADYNLKSTKTSGYSFIAENAKTDINFQNKIAKFSLNTDSSVVKFPEIQYICKMTDFSYNMQTRILNMEQKGKVNIPLLSADNLLKLDFKKLDKPTFFATDNNSDTVSFSAWKGSYHLDQEYIEADQINYIHIADALIQPDSGKIIINRRAKIQTLQNALLVINRKHVLRSGRIDIESPKRFSGSAVYDYIDENKSVQKINFPEIAVDTLITSARGYIPPSQNFMFNPAFTFVGDVTLFAKDDLLTYTGAAGIVQKCPGIKSYSIKFKSKIDPKNVMIPVNDKPRDINDNSVFSGSYINTDSVHIYPAFLSQQKSWTDVALVNSKGLLYYDKTKSRYIITSLEKLTDQTLSGNMIAFDKNFCVLSGEGNINFGAKFDLVNLSAAGKVIHEIDSGKVNIESIIALDFFFSPAAIKIMADEIRMMPTLKAVNLNTDLIKKGMKDLLGTAAASQIKEEMDLFGTSRNLPKEFNFELLLNDVKLKWNAATSSFRSNGKIGIGFIGQQPINVYVDGYIEIQRRRSGDMIDIYLKANESTWYYFSYVRGVLMTKAGDSAYNSIIMNTKEKDRKHPDSSVKAPYSYVIAVDDRLRRFLDRMTGAGENDTNPGNLDGLIR